jgi:phosphatidylglycerophosphatase A
VKGSTFLLWLAQGFGSGRTPFAPGTFGSLVGVAWFALLVSSGNLWMFLGGTLIGLALSVWLCGAGERILNQKDPASVVMDEIAAIPLCFSGWVLFLFSKTGSLPGLDTFFRAGAIVSTVGVFALFRLFDVWKPWPVRQSQSLPGGWGITVDDALAAVCVNLVVVAWHFGKGFLCRT